MKRARFFELRCNKCGQPQFVLVTQDLEIVGVHNGLEVFIPSNDSCGTFNKEPICSRNQTLNTVDTHDTDALPWAPDFALNSPCAMAVYGVRLPKDAFQKGFTSELYSNQYIQKVIHLLEQWEGEPLPVLFDRFFTAPYLGAGEPQQVLLDMWQQLEELRRPVAEVARLIDSGESLFPLEDSKAMELESVLISLKLDYFLECLSQMG
jgi:hypothetical protein